MCCPKINKIYTVLNAIALNPGLPLVMYEIHSQLLCSCEVVDDLQNIKESESVNFAAAHTIFTGSADELVLLSISLTSTVVHTWPQGIIILVFVN